MKPNLYPACLKVPAAAPNESRYIAYGAVGHLWSMATAGTMPQEILISGPAGTGKTRGNLEFLNEMAHTYKGCRILIGRKTRASLTQSVMQTYEEFVLSHNAYRVPFHTTKQAYEYPNGSRIVVAGFDKPSKLMSSEFDIIYIAEATELEENDIEMASTRLRYGKVPFQSLLLECNPGPPTHWLKLRADAGRMKHLQSSHTDNPTLYDWDTRTWTAKGIAYINKLAALTGARRQRLLLGLWAAAEGAVYTNWAPSTHLIYPFDIPASWDRYIAIDFGYTNAFVCQFWAEDTDGRLYLYRELVHTQRLVEDWAALIKSYPDFNKVSLIVTDHDAEDRATLERHLDRYTQAAIKDVSPGIQAVSARLKVAGDGKPRLMVMRDSLIDRDSEMAEAKKPIGVAEEIEAYTWALRPTTGITEAPLNINNHSMDAMRYMVAYRDWAGEAFTGEGLI